MNRPTNSFIAGYVLMGAFGGVLFSIGITLAFPLLSQPAWLQPAGVTALQAQMAVGSVCFGLGLLAFYDDAKSRYDPDAQTYEVGQ